MDHQIKERCIYCGGDVFYHSGESLIKCEWCGQTLVVAKFENELTRLKEAETEHELVKERLKEAEKEKQAANVRLFAALSTLGEIRDEQDSFGKVLHLLTDEQENAFEQLQFLKKISGQIIESQNDIFAQMDVMNEIRTRLQKSGANDEQQRAALTEFMDWSRQIREEDVQRLQEITSTADQLIDGQKEISEKINELKASADRHQQTLEAFQGQYTKDKLEELRESYHMAESLQYDRFYDRAETEYRAVIKKGGKDAEVYWRLIMCHYCLFYEKDDNGRMIPIILNPDLTDPDEMSLRKELAAHMTEKERPYYEAELKKIDRILDKYRLLKDEVEYDVFISVKQDDSGHYTSDSDVASDLYDFLASHGIRVFNSRRTSIPAGHEYEPYIISALISAKALIVVGTTPDNMSSTWVKNEWSRFQWLQYREKEKTGKSDRVLICYLAKGMRAEKIPKALHPDRQAIYDGVKAQSDLLAALSSLKKADIAAGRFGYIPTPMPEQDYGKIKNQMTLWLVRGKYDKVLEKYEQLNEEGLFLTSLSLHMTALCAKSEVADIMQIINSDFILEDAPEYKAAVLLCDDEKEKQTLEGYLTQNREWREKQNNKSITPISKEIKHAEQEKEALILNHENDFKQTPEVQSDYNKREIEKEQKAAPGQETAKSQYSLEESETNTIRFGRYDQKENGSPEPIEWQVLTRENGHMLVISKYALDCQPYNTSYANVTWENCTLRKWLNETFINHAFDPDEKKMIVSSKITADKNPTYNTSPGNNTVDKVFLLSLTEVNKYFNSKEASECQGTAYCYAQGAYKDNNDSCWWWLRSPGLDSFSALFVAGGGFINPTGYIVHIDYFAVRPALWIDLESLE